MKIKKFNEMNPIYMYIWRILSNKSFYFIDRNGIYPNLGDWNILPLIPIDILDKKKIASINAQNFKRDKYYDWTIIVDWIEEKDE